jgi:hypothetical protein
MIKKYTKTQKEALNAFKTYITSLEYGSTFAALASMQIKMYTEDMNDEESLDLMKIWCGAFMELMCNLIHDDFEEDFGSLLDNMSDAFPEDFRKISLKDTKLH